MFPAIAPITSLERPALQQSQAEPYRKGVGLVQRTASLERRPGRIT